MPVSADMNTPDYSAMSEDEFDAALKAEEDAFKAQLAEWPVKCPLCLKSVDYMFGNIHQRICPSRLRP